MLNDRLSGYLAYLERIAKQPPNRWDGFYLTKQPDSSVALHFQLAFSCYALATLSLHPDAEPEEQQRCRTAMAALIARVVQRRVWAFWGTAAERSNLVCDPIVPGNLQYSAPLAMMIGAYELVGGDDRYDIDGVTFLWNSDARFIYTHNALADSLWRQMRASRLFSVDGTPRRVYVPSMAHALWSNALHDATHGSAFGDVNGQWLTSMQRRFVFGGPSLPGRRVFTAAYDSRSRLRAPLSLTFIDAWGLALLAPLVPDLAQQLAPRLFRAVHQHSDGTASLPCAHMWQRREWGDGALTNGFGYLLAVELGQHELAESLLRYADTALGPIEEAGERSYTHGAAPIYTTALFALGEAGGLSRLHAALTERAQALEIAHDPA